MRTRLVPALLLLAACGAPACARSPDGTTVERFGGRLRARPFASATAYEAYLRGELAAARGDLAEADRQLNLAAFADAADPWIVARRVHHLLAAGQRARAVEVARDATGRHPDASGAWLALAAALGEAPATLPERDAALARAVGLDPEDAEVRDSAVRIASRRSATDAAPAPRASAGAGVAVERLAEAGAWSRVAAALAATARRRPAAAGDALPLAVARVCAGDLRGAHAALEALSRRRASVDRTTLAWLWLRAGEPARAAEESALALTEGVAGAAAVRALALAADGRAAAALRAAALVDARDRAPDVAPAAPAPWAGRCVRSGAIGRAEGSPVGSALALVTAGLAGALDRAGHAALADLVADRATARLRALGPEGAAARDLLRAASSTRAERLGRDPARALAEVETADGRLARAALAGRRGNGPEAAADLAAADDDPEVAGLAAAWRVLVCAADPSRCDAALLAASAEAVRASIDEAPVALRARALLARDPSALDRADDADPRSPWGAVVRAALVPATGAAP